jgi:hypothetical protein
MTWHGNKRALGVNICNLQSGHGTLGKVLYRKVIGLVIKSKICKQCNAMKKRHPDDAPDHYHICWKNQDGSSSSMEQSKGRVELVVEAFKKHKVVISRLCLLAKSP